MIQGRINCFCPGPCPGCGEVTENLVLCDTCANPLPPREHPKKCQSCGRWECSVGCLAAQRVLELV